MDAINFFMTVEGAGFGASTVGGILGVLAYYPMNRAERDLQAGREVANADKLRQRQNGVAITAITFFVFGQTLTSLTL